MGITTLMTDDAILAEMGRRMARYRIDSQITQARLAEEAGVSKRTIERIEAGASVQFSTIIRVLRVLDLISGLEELFPETVARPMALIKQKGHQRKRASSGRRSDQLSEKWSWGDGA